MGGGSRIKLIDCIRIIEEISGKKAKLSFGESQRGDARHTYADVSKAEKDFRYSPTVSIREGLTEHYNWLKKNMELYVSTS